MDIPFLSKQNDLPPPLPSFTPHVPGQFSPLKRKKILVCSAISTIALFIIVAVVFIANRKVSILTSAKDTPKTRLQELALRDGNTNADNFVHVDSGKAILLDLGEKQTISQLTLWQDGDKPGLKTTGTQINIATKSDLSDKKTVFEGDVMGGEYPLTISFPPTDGQFVEIIQGSNDAGGSNINEVAALNPPTPTAQSFLFSTPTPTPFIPINPATSSTQQNTSQNSSFTPSPTSFIPSPSPQPTVPPASTPIGNPTPTPISIHMTVTSNSGWGASQTNLPNVVNGIIDASDYAQVELGKYIQVNFPGPITITKIQVYPRAVQGQILKAMKVEASTGQLFYGDVLTSVSGVIVIPSSPIQTSYIRVTAQGTRTDQTLDPVNRYTEIAVWGN